jgi:uncharacterized protein YecT (DUF1311 family)
MSLYSGAMAGVWSGRVIIGVALLGGVLSVAACLSAGAQERTRLPDAPCKNDGTTNHTTQCMIVAARKADRELEGISRVLRKELKPAEYQAFEAAQSRWYPFREADCIAERDLYTELSDSSLAYAACAEGVTRYRVEELKMIYAWLFQ